MEPLWISSVTAKSRTVPLRYRSSATSSARDTSISAGNGDSERALAGATGAGPADAGWILFNGVAKSVDELREAGARAVYDDLVELRGGLREALGAASRA